MAEEAKETTTREKAIPLTLEAIIKEAKRIEENTLFSSKSHFVTSRFWTNFHLWIGIPTLILAGTAGTLAFSQYPKQNVAAGVLSIIVAILTAIATFLNPKERANTYFTAGNNYDSLLTNVRIFWTIDCRRESSEEILTEKLRMFVEQRDRLNRDCPQPPKWAYKEAKKGIEEGEATYKVDGKPETQT